MLLSIEQVSKNYGERELLRDITLYLNPGDRVGVVGVNGCGKSTFLKVAAGAEPADSGTVKLYPGARLSYLEQDPAYEKDESVLDFVLRRSPEAERFEAESILNKLGLTDTGAKMGELSGGQRKRAALASCLASPAEVLILDEPTNHLDIAMIAWLEKRLEKFTGALLFVSHDRYFLERVARHTAEVSFGRLFVAEGGYTAYLENKARREEMEAASERKRRSVLRRELIWVLQGPCARGTKSRERLERYEKLKAQLPPDLDGEMEEVAMPASRLGKKTVSLKAASAGYGENTVVAPFDFELLRDDRVGILGLNGCGKTTLLNLIAGRIPPLSGTVETGETVKIGYFSQHADELDGTETALAYVKERGDSIETGEGRLSAKALMEMFNFPRELQFREIGRLSGGEKRRLYLLGILAEAPNVLLLDEPTNDLDIPTLQVLENYVARFPGAVVAVSHDRYFLDRVCKRLFVMERGKAPAQHTGGDSGRLLEEVAAGETNRAPEPASAPKQARPRERALRFSYKEQRDFETIEADIAALEEKLSALEKEKEAACADYVRLQTLEADQSALESALEEKMERWMYLSELNEKILAQK